MMSCRIKSLGVIACLLLTVSAALASTGSISGSLTTTYGARVVYATVTAVPGGVSTLSYQDGNYTLSGLQPGTYTVMVTKTDRIVSQSCADVESLSRR